MNQDAFQDRIQDYLDGLLEGEALREFEEHLLAHPEARELLDATRRLFQQVAAHPREIQPPQDLWPRIARAIQQPVVELPAARNAGGETGPSPVPVVARRPWSGWFERPWVWGGVAAAATLAVVLFLVAQPGLEKETAAPGMAVVESGAPFWPDMVRALEAECVAADVQVAASLQDQGGVFSPATLRGLRADLRVLDAAAMDLQRALAGSPGDPELNMQLMKTYERKLSVLKQVERAARRA